MSFQKRLPFVSKVLFRVVLVLTEDVVSRCLDLRDPDGERAYPTCHSNRVPCCWCIHFEEPALMSWIALAIAIVGGKESST